MHDNELTIGDDDVRLLVTEQALQLGERSIRRVDSNGTDFALFRLGDDLVARLPRIYWAASAVSREWSNLVHLVDSLSFEIPQPVYLGRRSDSFPWDWMIVTWINGRNPVVDSDDIDSTFARSVARITVELHALDPVSNERSSRGAMLVDRDKLTRAAIRECGDCLDVTWALGEWERALAAGGDVEHSTLIHGDLSPGNLLVEDRELTGVIDFTTVTAGDPACDVMVAWNLLSAATRGTYRDELSIDDSTWQRGRGWALSVAAIQWPYYRTRSAALAASSQRVFAELLTDPD